MKLGGRVAAVTFAGLMVSGIAAPAWADGLTDELKAALDDYSQDGARLGDGEYDDALGNWVNSGLLDSSLVVVTPGTDDTGLVPRTAGLVGNRENRIVDYPQAFWPVISGTSGELLPFLAPTYDASKDIATDNNVEIMKALKDVDRVVVYTGYSQGSDALGNAAERAHALGEKAAEDGVLDENTLILLVSDPRGPWGLKSGLEKIPFSAPLMAIIGAESDGARDPKDTGDTEVVQVIVAGDPVANWQWNPFRPVSSLLVDLAGFVTIHSATSEYSYANLDELELVKTLDSAEGNTRYEVYDTYHPLALVNAMIADALGIEVSEDQLDEWDRQAEFFYPLQEISPETADKDVKVVAELSPEEKQARHRLLDANGDEVEAAPSTGAKYQPKHALPETTIETPSDGTGTTAPTGVTGTGTADTGTADTGDTDSGQADAGQGQEQQDQEQSADTSADPAADVEPVESAGAAEPAADPAPAVDVTAQEDVEPAA